MIGASEKMLLVRSMSVCAFASVGSYVDLYADTYAVADSYVDSPDTTIRVPVSALAPVVWDCNEIAGYSAFVGLRQIDRAQQPVQQPDPGGNLREAAAKVHQLGLEQVNLWQVD